MNRTSWLSSIPTHWTVRRAAHVIDMDVGGTPSTSRPEYFDGDIPWLTIADMTSESITRCEKYLSRTGVEAGRIPWSRKGDLLYSFKLSIGKIAFTKIDLVTNEAIASIHSSSRIDLRYAYWMLPLAYEAAASRNIYGSPILNQQQLRTARLPMPPLSEQQQIADYLDHETAEIDAAIADQEKFMKLLNERRQSLTWSSISGADQPSNRVKTGDDFWRSIPDDWTLQKLGWHFKIGNGSTPSTSTPRFWNDSGFPWVNSSVVNHALVIEPVRRVTDAALQELHLPIVPSGSLLVGITGQGKTRGTVTKLGITTTINQHVAYMTPLNERIVTTDYTRAALTASYPQLRQISDGNGGTKGALTCEMLQQFKIPIPPRDVQDQTVETLSSQSERISSALDDASAVIDLARERRAALITAAVTGQIDVTAKNKPAAEQLEDDIAQGLHREHA